MTFHWKRLANSEFWTEWSASQELTSKEVSTQRPNYNVFCRRQRWYDLTSGWSESWGSPQEWLQVQRLETGIRCHSCSRIGYHNGRWIDPEAHGAILRRRCSFQNSRGVLLLKVISVTNSSSTSVFISWINELYSQQHHLSICMYMRLRSLRSH